MRCATRSAYVRVLTVSVQERVPTVTEGYAPSRCVEGLASASCERVLAKPPWTAPAVILDPVTTQSSFHAVNYIEMQH